MGPRERCLVDVQTPDVVDRFGSSIAAENEEIRLAEDDCVAISSARCSPNDWYDHPLSSLVTVPQIEQVQVIGRQTSTYRESFSFLMDYLPPVAPPYTTICNESTWQLPCAALGEGATPELTKVKKGKI